MALTPASARTARRVLATTAAATGLSVAEVARVLVTRVPGVPVTGPLGRALRHAVQLARTAPAGAAAPSRLPVPGGFRAFLGGGDDAEEGPGPAPRLAPDRRYTARVLARYLACDAAARAAPADGDARRDLDDAAYTLCVLMAGRTPQEAVRAARAYLAGPQAP
ncbi:DUF5133 domain-containing protein [Streptomyces bambusae]|uniref:DUF5133 domain-containing protein n=2 Tax=Streptomyces bambusae TaxID=1550616 RepID=A0ABS6Z3P4_9ACTN|nr:DUF5133 domain-containing protein [Streptomyces bambusae]